MYPVLFQLGSLTFYTHGVFAVLGVILGAYVSYGIAKKSNLNAELFFDNIVFTVLFGIIGARLSYFVIYHSQFESWTKIFYIWEGGLVSYGGIIFGIATFILLLRKQKESVPKWLDVGAIGFFLGLAIGRIGEIFAGEWAGVPTTSRWLSVFPSNNQIAIPFFEAILCLVIFTASAMVYRRFYDKIGDTKLFLGTFFLYGLGRLMIDFGRDEKSLIFGLSLGQIVSLLVVIITLILILSSDKERSQNESVQGIY